MPSNRTDDEIKLLTAFGIHLRSLRIAAGFTQEDLGEKAGFSRSYYTDIERGKRNISLINLQRLANCLQISIPQLLDFKSIPDTKTPT